MKFSKILLVAMLGCVGLQAQWVKGFFIGNDTTLSVSNIPWSKYTEITHFAAYAGVNGSNIGNGSVNMSDIPDTAALIASRPVGKRVLLCLKDNNSFPSAFGQSAAAGTRATFVSAITTAVVSNGYDGVELDWEGNVNTSDYIALIAALRVSMPTKIIALDVGDFGGLPTVANGAQANLDEVNVECYDMDGNGSNNSDCGGVNCSWFNDAVLSAGDAFKNTCQQRTGVITGAGVAAAKIGIGIPYYGRIWNGTTVPQTVGTFATATVLYRDLVVDAKFTAANQRYDSVHDGQYLSVSSSNQFISYTGTQQIGDIVTWVKSQNFGGYFTFTINYEFRSSQTGDARYPLSTALNTDVFVSQFPVNSAGIIQTGLPAAQDNILGPLIPSGNSPWIYGDLAEKQTADNMAPIALSYAPALGTQLAGTVSWVTGNQFFTTTSDLTSSLSGQSWMVVTWTTVDGPGTGRMLCSISSVTSNRVNCSDGDFFQPTTTGASAYLLPPAVSVGGTNVDFQQWTTGCPSTVWNYYDVAIGLYRLYYRTGNSTYLAQARQYADITWQWTLDHGYRVEVCPRAATMLSQFFRALDGHPERLPGLYNWISIENPRWANPASSPAIDNREAGYIGWAMVLGAKTDTNTMRHAQYCSWLSQYTPTWITVQAADGSWPEQEYALNQSYVSAPKTFTSPFIYQGAPWREAINVRHMEAAYESFSDTSSQGCNNPTLAASILTSITKAATWQNNAGRDTSNRGIFYEVNSASDDQNTVNGSGTVSINVGSTTLTGSGTNWQTSGYCDGTHFIGIAASVSVYKIASCVSNTAATLTAAYGLYGESTNVSGSTISFAPASFTGCASSATYCFGPTGDRNLVRTTCGGFGWLYAQTLNATYKSWTDECLSAVLGGPTSGLTTAATIGDFSLPCSGAACDGLVNDSVSAAASCYTQPAPCVYGSTIYSKFGKDYGEQWGAPGIDNALAWRLPSPVGPPPPPPPPPSPPVITSTLIVPGTQGTPLSYQITASNSPTTFGASNLPTGLTVTTFNGVISGTPTVSGTINSTITATNSGGTGSATLLFSISNPPPPPPPAPVITSSLTSTVTQNTTFSYQITATNSPSSYNATSLPTGLSVNTSTGLISGTPSVAGNFNVNISAANSGGTGAAVLRIVVVVPPPPAPVITSALTDTATNGSPYSYQITATNTPTSYGAASLATGLSVNTSTGLISGTPSVSGNFNINISATNAGGTGTAVLALAISSPPPPPPPPTPPVITSALTATVAQSATFTYQITATNSPTGFGASGLPTGLSISTSSGVISGAPTGAGTFSVTISAINSGGTGTAVLNLTVTPPPPPPAPVITSSLSVAGTQGTAFSYRITATNTPTGFGATNLPPGLSVVTSTGVISGTPSASGNYTPGISAVNAGGTGSASLALTILASPPPPPPPTLTCDLNHDGVVNILDVQLMTNQVLGLVGCNNDLTQNGSCDMPDITRVVIAAQGGACKIGP